MENEWTKSGSNAGYNTKWQSMSVLAFLEPHLQDRQNTSNMVEGHQITVESLLLPIFTLEREVVCFYCFP